MQPTPVYLISRQVKALKNFEPTEPGSSEHLQARSMLGKVFGTKKAKAAIQARERNKVDVSAMEDMAGMLQDRIEEGTENLPSQGASRLASLLRIASLMLKGWQKKWRIQQMLRASSLLTMPMPRDQKTFIPCITSSQSQNGPPWTASSPNSKTQQTTAHGRVCCPTPAAIGCDSTSCSPTPPRSLSLKLCLCPLLVPRPGFHRSHDPI